jgi:hypothetical protein
LSYQRFFRLSHGGRTNPLQYYNQSCPFAAWQQNFLNQPDSFGVGRSRCDSKNELVDPTSSCFGHCHYDDRNPFPYQWSYHLVPTQVEGINPCSYAAVTIQLEDIPVVCEYPYVFPDDLPGMPPDKDVEFVIELQPRPHLYLKGLTECHPKSWLS